MTFSFNPRPDVHIAYLNDDVKELYQERHPKEEAVPFQATSLSAGFDLIAPYSFQLMPGETLMIHLGIKSHVVSDTKLAMLFVPKSGTGSAGLVLANLVGVIDEDYQGEWILNVWNRNTDTYLSYLAGNKIGQAIFVPVLTPNFHVNTLEELAVLHASSNTTRGAGAFGSTGK